MQTLTEARDTAQRQLDAEGKKKTNKVGLCFCDAEFCLSVSSGAQQLNYICVIF